MIVLTAQMRIQGENPLPFTLGVSELGSGALFGETIYEEVKFDRRNLLSLESEVKDRADIDKPSFGIISTGGSLSFKDNSSRFLNYANAGLLTEGIEIKIFLENTVKKTKKQVGQYYTTDWDYDNDNRSVSVSFSDDLEDLQDTIIEEVPIQYEEKSLLWFFNIINKKIENISISDNFLRFLEEYKLKFPYMYGGTIWNEIVKICEASHSHCYKDSNGIIVFEMEYN